MPGPKPNKLHDELDALLDGRPVELTYELAPLVEAAGALRAELATFELDPEVADRHLERVLQGPGTVVTMPARQPNGWDLRRRVAAVVLAAALVLAPATMASAAALPGQAMYPFKLAIEQLRLASVQWSPAREAGERTRVADVRLEEVETLIRLQMFTQLPNALKAFNKAVLAAQRAVAEADKQGAPVLDVARRLAVVKADGMHAVDEVEAAARNASVPISGSTLDAIQEAVDQSKTVLPLPVPEAAPSGAPPAGPATKPSSPTSPSNTGPDPSTTQPSTQPSSTTGPEPTATSVAPPPTDAPTTTEATTTTAPPPSTTEDTSDPGSGDQPAGDESIVGESAGRGHRPADVPPTTTLGP